MSNRISNQRWQHCGAILGGWPGRGATTRCDCALKIDLLKQIINDVVKFVRESRSAQVRNEVPLFSNEKGEIT